MSATLDKCRQWVALALPSLTEVVHEPVAAGAPRPALPYAGIQIRQDESIQATLDDAVTDTPGDADPNKVKHVVGELREGVLRVSLYGGDAPALARQLRRSLELEPTWQLLKGDLSADPVVDLPVAVWPIGPVLDLTGVRDTANEPQAQHDFGIRFWEESVEEVDWVETVTPVFEEAS